MSVRRLYILNKINGKIKSRPPQPPLSPPPAPKNKSNGSFYSRNYFRNESQTGPSNFRKNFWDCYWGKFANSWYIHPVHPPKFCKSIVFNLFWDDRKTQDKLKTIVMQNFGGQTKCIMDNVTMLNWPLRGCAGELCKDLLPRPSPPPFR